MASKALDFSKNRTVKAESYYNEMFGIPKATGEENIVTLQLEQLQEFQGHLFPPYPEDELWELAEDIRQRGLDSPIIVRPTCNNQYEILAGHNRTAASKLAGLTTIKAIIKDGINDEMATMIMLNTNLIHRKKMAFSTRAKAYQKRAEIMQQMGIDYTTAKIAEEMNENKRTIQRYLRLNELIPELLEKIDNEQLSLIVGVNLSYRTKEEQELIFLFIEEHTIVISLEQSDQIKKYDLPISDTTLTEILLPPKKQTITPPLPENLKANTQQKNTNKEVRHDVAPTFNRHNYPLSWEVLTQYMGELTDIELSNNLKNILSIYI